jgi:hypothetical protein
LIWCFGQNINVSILSDIVALRTFCFCQSTIETVKFDSGSRLKQTEKLCFKSCSLQSICIPSSVGILCKSCFRNSRLQPILFESGSRLKRIGESCFEFCSLQSIYIPSSIEILWKWYLRGSKLKKFILNVYNIGNIFYFKTIWIERTKIPEA